MNKNGKTIFWGTLAAIALLGVLLSFTVFLPQRAAIREKRALAAQEQQEIAQVENFMNAHLDFAAFQKEVAEKEKATSRRLPDDLEQSAFLSSLQTMALQEGLTLKGVRPGQAQGQGHVLSLPVALEVEGDYFSLLHFLAAIEKDERFVRIDNALVHSDQGKLSCKISLHIYAFSDGMTDRGH